MPPQQAWGTQDWGCPKSIPTAGASAEPPLSETSAQQHHRDGLTPPVPPFSHQNKYHPFRRNHFIFFFPKKKKQYKY